MHLFAPINEIVVEIGPYPARRWSTVAVELVFEDHPAVQTGHTEVIVSLGRRLIVEQSHCTSKIASSRNQRGDGVALLSHLQVFHQS